MANPEKSVSLRELFELASDLEELADRLHDGVQPRVRERLLLQRRDLITKLSGLLEGSKPLPDLLRALKKKCALQSREFMVVLLLLNRRVALGGEAVSGRTLLEVLAHNSFDLLNLAALLEPSAPLRATGLVRAQGVTASGPLDTEFRIAERLYSDLLASSQKRKKKIDRTPPPPLTGANHLVELWHLVQICAQRAAGLFPSSYWADVMPESHIPPEELNEVFHRVHAFLKTREKATPKETVLPAKDVQKEYGLSDDELIIVLALLFQELFASPSVLEASELIRLVSTSLEDVFRKRSLLSASSILREHGLVVVDSDIEGKDVYGEAYIAGWVSERFLAGLDAPPAIQPNEQQRFHRFLDGLSSSEDFYRHL